MSKSPYENNFANKNKKLITNIPVENKYWNKFVEFLGANGIEKEQLDWTISAMTQDMYENREHNFLIEDLTFTEDKTIISEISISEELLSLVKEIPHFKKLTDHKIIETVISINMNYKIRENVIVSL